MDADDSLHMVDVPGGDQPGGADDSDARVVAETEALTEEAYYTTCPVCLQPWGDITHLMYYELDTSGDAVAPVARCTRKDKEDA